MAKWFDLGSQDKFPPGSKHNIKLGGASLMVCNVAGQLHAVANSCPHAGLPLHEGEISGKVITCPYHGYAYHLETGKNVDFPQDEYPLPVFPIRVSPTGVVQVDLAKLLPEDDPETKPAGQGGCGNCGCSNG